MTFTDAEVLHRFAAFVRGLPEGRAIDLARELAQLVTVSEADKQAWGAMPPAFFSAEDFLAGAGPLVAAPAYAQSANVTQRTAVEVAMVDRTGRHLRLTVNTCWPGRGWGELYVDAIEEFSDAPSPLQRFLLDRQRVAAARGRGYVAEDWVHDLQTAPAIEQKAPEYATMRRTNCSLRDYVAAMYVAMTAAEIGYLDALGDRADRDCRVRLSKLQDVQRRNCGAGTRLAAMAMRGNLNVGGWLRGRAPRGRPSAPAGTRRRPVRMAPGTRTFPERGPARAPAMPSLPDGRKLAHALAGPRERACLAAQQAVAAKRKAAAESAAGWVQRVRPLH